MQKYIVDIYQHGVKVMSRQVSAKDTRSLHNKIIKHYDYSKMSYNATLI